MSLTSREEALHSMRPLKQTQGHTAPVVEGYWDAAYDPNQEAQGHRFRAPSWTLPPNRCTSQAKDCALTMYCSIVGFLVFIAIITIFACVLGSSFKTHHLGPIM